MRLEAKKYLFNVQQAICLLNEFVGDRTFADYLQDAMLRAAVERQFEIIGEAVRQLVHIDESTAARLSEYHRIVAFRNILIHEYGDVDDRLVWDVLETRLPTLEQEVGTLLSDG